MILKTFYEPVAWLSTGRAELDAVGCKVEVISRDISRFERDFSAPHRLGLLPRQKQSEGEGDGENIRSRLLSRLWVAKEHSWFISVSRAMQPRHTEDKR